MIRSARCAALPALGLAMLLLLAACGSVAGSGTNGSGTTAPTATSAPPTSTTTGTLTFYGTVTQVSPTSVTVTMPDGHAVALHMVAGQTDLSGCDGTMPRTGQQIQAHAAAHHDGTYTATSLAYPHMADHHDTSQVEYHGITTSAVGADRVLHFQVGSTQYAFPVSATADLGDFGHSAQAIGANQSVDVHVQFVGTTGTVIEVDRWDGH